MKKVYDVRWSETSEKDLTDIMEYIAGDSPSHAYEVFKEIKRKTSSLRTSPDRGRIVPELQDQGITQYRELIVTPWRIIYRISEKRGYTPVPLTPTLSHRGRRRDFGYWVIGYYLVIGVWLLVIIKRDISPS